MTKKICLLFSTIIFTSLNCFDWKYYLANHSDLRSAGMYKFHDTFIHFLNNGINEGRLCAEPYCDTNFDWEYYVKYNNLKGINNEQEAQKHYQEIGKAKGLEYCKKYKICIFLHLYDISLADEFIYKINNFMKINNLNTYYIKINVPVADNVLTDLTKLNNNQEKSENKKRNKVLSLTPYHKFLITQNNYQNLYTIYKYLQNKLNVSKQNLQVIFSENRGLDIGSFFLLMDQTIKQNLEIDYFVKVHSKSWPEWRQLSTSILNIKVNKLLREKSFVTTCWLDFSWIYEGQINISNVSNLLNEFNLPKLEFGFSAGTMFIASYKMLDFFKNHNLLNLFNKLNVFATHPKIETIEHAWERFFGYLVSYLNLDLQIIDYRKSDFYLYV